MAAGPLPLKPCLLGVFFKTCCLLGWGAGVAEVVKGAGLKIRSRMGSWVRIPPPALLFCSDILPLVEGVCVNKQCKTV